MAEKMTFIMTRRGIVSKIAKSKLHLFVFFVHITKYSYTMQKISGSKEKEIC